MTDYTVYLRDCLSRWASQDEKTGFFKDGFSDWIAQIPDDVLPTIISLLQDFNYYSHQKVNDLFTSLHSKLLDYNCIKEENTIYTYLPSKDGRLGSSIEYMIDYKRMNHLSKFCFSDNMEEISPQRWDAIQNIVVIDDCCGTGSKFSEYIQSKRDNFVSKTIYYVVIEIMSEALNCIEGLKAEYGISIYVLAGKISEKAFSSSKWGNDLENVRSVVFTTSVSKGIPQQFAMGFKNAESLMAFYNDTPNDTIGLFWHNTNTYHSPFPREFAPEYAKPKRPTPQQVALEKNTRKSQNYGAMKRSGSNG